MLLACSLHCPISCGVLCADRIENDRPKKKTLMRPQLCSIGLRNLHFLPLHRQHLVDCQSFRGYHFAARQRQLSYRSRLDMGSIVQRFRPDQLRLHAYFFAGGLQPLANVG